jgi:hypothetical protein
MSAAIRILNNPPAVLGDGRRRVMRGSVERIREAAAARPIAAAPAPAPTRPALRDPSVAAWLDEAVERLRAAATRLDRDLDMLDDVARRIVSGDGDKTLRGAARALHTAIGRDRDLLLTAGRVKP